MNDKLTSCLGVILGIAIAAIVGAILDGWALSTIWNWFIPPIFGLTTLTFFQAIGVSMVLSLFTGTRASSKDSDNTDKSFGEALLSAVFTSFFKNLFVVAFAWVIYQLAF